MITSFFLKIFLKKFIYFWLCWVFASVWGLSLVAASGGHSSSQCAVLSLSRPLLLRSTSSRHAGSVVVAHGPSCSAARGILPDKGPNPCPPHWQADSQPLRHQGSPLSMFSCVCWMSSLEKHLFRSSAHLLIVLLWLLSCTCSLYVSDINPLSDVWFANIFSHLVGCLFILLFVSYGMQKLFSFM